MTQERFYKTKAWRLTRDAFIQYRKSVDGGICQVCQNDLGKIVHHIVWLDDVKVNNPQIALNFDNLRYECQLCHNREKNPDDPKGGRTGSGRITYTADGEILINGSY